MHNHKFLRLFLSFSTRITSFLPSLFWLLLIFGFDEPSVSAITILAALIHEAGHELCAYLNNGHTLSLRTSFSGFKIKQGQNSSYLSDVLLYASGPMANFAVALAVFLFPAFNQTEFCSCFCTINLATGLSNLLPVRGYDGYGILSSLIKKYSIEEGFNSLLDNISFLLIIFFTFLSLYIVARIGSSYWMAGIFIFSLVGEVCNRIKSKI